LKDYDYMALAIDLAAAAKGQTSPNPTVGAIVVRNGQIVGIGAHLKAGEPHAEVHALNMAGEKAKDATIYVTMEPCSHYGKTPPCADLIIRRGIKRVVIAAQDPNPRVAGSGIAKLREAGLEVETGLLSEKAQQLNEDFDHYIRTKTPYVTLKTAMSLDGKIATSTGDSKWITGTEAREDVHRYRHQHDAILVGVGTVLHDDPLLTTRIPGGGKHPIRIILDHHLRTPLNANVLNDESVETWIVIGGNVPNEKKSLYRQKHVKLIEMEDGIHLPDLMVRLGKMGISSLFVEGGATVNGSFLTSKLVHQVIIYLSPILIGGNNAPTSFGGGGFQSLHEALQLDITSIEQIGKDIKLIAKTKRGDGFVHRDY